VSAGTRPILEGRRHLVTEQDPMVPGIDMTSAHPAVHALAAAAVKTGD
jgi:hypothetical protein